MSEISLKIQTLAVFTVAHDKNQAIEIRTVDYLDLGPDGPDKKEVKIMLPPAMCFGISKKGHIIGAIFRVAVMFMKIGRLLQFY